MRRIKFLKHQYEKMQSGARRLAKIDGREICGLILDNRYFFELIEVRNKTKRGGGFSFYYNEVRAIRKMARLCKHEIVGTFHSHPVGLSTPGESDLHNAVDGSMMLIFDVMGGSAEFWHIKNQKGKRLRFSLL
jgi:proteasome lid subunit RPN8/RPN11